MFDRGFTWEVFHLCRNIPVSPFPLYYHAKFIYLFIYLCSMRLNCLKRERRMIVVQVAMDFLSLRGNGWEDDILYWHLKGMHKRFSFPDITLNHMFDFNVCLIYKCLILVCGLLCQIWLWASPPLWFVLSVYFIFWIGKIVVFYVKTEIWKACMKAYKRPSQLKL